LLKFPFIKNNYAAFTLNGFDDQERNFTVLNGFPSFKTQISCLQYDASYLSSSQTKFKPACVNAALDSVFW